MKENSQLSIWKFIKKSIRSKEKSKHLAREQLLVKSIIYEQFSGEVNVNVNAKQTELRREPNVKFVIK